MNKLRESADSRNLPIRRMTLSHLDEPLVVLDHVGEHAEDAEELVGALLGEDGVVARLVVLQYGDGGYGPVARRHVLMMLYSLNEGGGSYF